MKRCISCGAEIPEKQSFCPKCGTPIDEVQTTGDYSQTIPDLRAQNYSMKWHNFQMVIMIIGAILTMINGLMTISGTVYLRQGVSADNVYAVYPGLKSTDVMYGIAVICLGIFEWIVRNKLNKFCANGPTMLKTLYIASIAVELIYLAAASSATNINLFDASTIGSITGSVLFFIINSVYYGRRKGLFIN